MVQKQRKRSLITALSILVVLLTAIGTITLTRYLNSNNDPYLKGNITSETSTPAADANVDAPTEVPDEPTKNVTTSEPQGTAPVDPASVGTLDVVPMEITVSYVKGIGGFEYEVLRATNGTRYIEFRSPELVGTKCTNDMGTFVSIMANPTDNDSSTVTKTTKVGDMTYGLSLSDATCSNNSSKLAEFQKSFSDAFSLLKKIQ